MCGRYVSTRRPQDSAQLFHVAQWPAAEALAPNWNVAPADDVRAVLERTPHSDDGGTAPVGELRPLRWGLVPSWAKEPKVGARMIKARMETVHEKPAFRRAFVITWYPASMPMLCTVHKAAGSSAKHCLIVG
ncbi:SOS response-associated peptidase family protein [Streptomyces sp. 5-8]|uniref:Abasic site processing protein n=1 Tax=Streptomyces musisoli TaxID=2802280 RepID=A0ABS1PCP7_9ACTN|nr:SOS response-associated peptidase family protein [Streptomyces musisoli]